MSRQTMRRFLLPSYSHRVRSDVLAMAALVAILPFLMASSCKQPTALANIHYEQLGACNGFTKPRALGGGVQTPGPGHAYIVFRIKTISNTDPGARDFSFDPEKLFIDENPRPFAVGYYDLGWRNPRAVEKRIVGAGTTETFNGTVTVESNQGDAAATTNISFVLLFDTPSGTQGTFVTKDNSSKTSWNYTNDCADIEKEFPNP